MRADLSGKIAVVAGATRGAGRGIARALGERGATVYCTGRSTRASPPRERGTAFDLSRRPETIEESAELVTEAGGKGIARRVDHARTDDVTALRDAIREAHGKLDFLIDDIWGGDELVEWGTPLSDLDLEKGFTLLERALHTHLITVRELLPLLRAPGGVVFEITDGDRLNYRGNLFYDLAKHAVIRLSFALSEELRAQGIASVAVTPGFLRSEAMLDHFDVTEATWRDAVEKDPHFLHSESPLFVGRGIAALAADPEVLRHSGSVLASWTLGKAYGLTDADGSRPDFGAHADESDFGSDQRASHDRFVAGAGGYPLRRA